MLKTDLYSAIKSGREVERILYVKTATLNSILWGSGNQWSGLRSGRACDIRGCCNTTQPSEFWTRWSFWMVGAPYKTELHPYPYADRQTALTCADMVSCLSTITPRSLWIRPRDICCVASRGEASSGKKEEST